jgi:DNA (cytosine-5)-methyltransferase 1
VDFADFVDRVRFVDYVRPAEFIYPLSRYNGYKPPLPVSKERHVVDEFLAAISQHKLETMGDGDGERMSPVGSTASDEGFIEFELTSFSIYLPGAVARVPFEMRALQNLATKAANSWYCFDGILRSGKLRRYVQCVPFKLCSIGNYGKKHHGVGDNIWIQSVHNEGSDVHYRLKAPSPEYERYHEGFVWLANLAKHFVDYSKTMSDRNRKISIRSFKSDFADWLHKAHRGSLAFQAWFQQYGSRDFRCHIAANIDFLWKEAIGTWNTLAEQPIWKEAMTLDAIPLQKVKGDGTVVTPYVYDCFSHLQFGSHLRKVAPIGGIDIRRRYRGHALNLNIDGVSNSSKANRGIDSPRMPPKAAIARQMHGQNVERSLDRKSIVVGDVLGVTMDGFGSKWKNEQSKWEATDDCWYVYVQGVNGAKRDRTFDVIWLYKPSHTSCAIMKYPHQSELFLSDNCWHGMPEDEVIGRVSVSWGCLPNQSKSDFFIRQTYCTQDNSFITMKESHKRCAHCQDAFKTPLQDIVDRYRIGDTVLVVPPTELDSRYDLEPAEIVEFVQEGQDGLVVMRRLLRRRDLDRNTCSRPNELVYTDQTFTIRAENVKRKCLVRFYSIPDVENRTIPTPYDRDGTGDAYYILTRLVEGVSGDPTGLQPIEHQPPSSLIQGFDSTLMPEKEQLRGLDLYCGGGNFGRGLEEGGAIHYTHAVDLNKAAIHSYYANLKDSESTRLYYGSVDDMLEQTLLGNPSGSKVIPLPGEIDFISAGSPCQGFSLLNSKRGNEKGLKNQSLVASVAAYVDVYRPKYALLENVISMAQKGKRRSEDVLSQLICCLVGMGYQVRLFNLDAWSFGSPQSRSRIFVSIVAPGFELPAHPELSHSHPEGTKDRGLGKMANNENFGQRRFGPTPFKFLTSGEATKDLPDIGDGQTYQCIRHPDHRMSVGIPQLLRRQIELIPLNPPGMNFILTLMGGLLTDAERDLFPQLTRNGHKRQNTSEGSRAWGRIDPRGLFQNIATSNGPVCARSGCTLHWSQQRLITVLEARRAQSFPDNEVLLGTAVDQWRIVGNSVARSVSLALGLSLREAWLKNAPDEARNVACCTPARAQPCVKYPCSQDSFDEETSDKRYKKSLGTMSLVSSISTSQDEGSSPASSLTLAKARTPQERKRKFSINTQALKKPCRLEPSSERREKSRDHTSSKASAVDESELGEPPRQVQWRASTRVSRIKLPMTVMRRLQVQHEAFHVPSKHKAAMPLAPSEGLNGRQVAPVHTDRQPVVLVTPPRKDTNRVILQISDSEDEPVKDQSGGGIVVDNKLVFTSSAMKGRGYVPVDNDMFAAYKMTYDSAMAGRGRKGR